MSLHKKLLALPTTKLTKLIKQNKSISQVVIAVGFTKQNSRARNYIKQFAINNNLTKYLIQYSEHRGTRYTIEDIKRIVPKCITISEVVRKLGLQCHGGNIRTIQNKIKRYDIDTSHFNIKKALRKNKNDYSKEQIFCINSVYGRTNIRRAVIRFNVLQYQCKVCNNSGMWNNQPITLQLDHINGVTSDNRIENLRFLCPNCHSQTLTYGNKKR